jgi:peptidoglycan/LPS O-acetylase OafA/YrhL
MGLARQSRLAQPTEPPKSEARIPELDGIRGVAILLVLTRHFGILVPDGGLSRFVPSLVGLGATGVDLFFVLSGFLITGILIRTKESTHYFRNFYLRRILRIFPLYFAFLAVYFFLHPYVEQWRYWAYLSNWRTDFGGEEHALGHLWSLAVEEQFYLLWPLLVWLCPTRRLAWLCAALPLLSATLRLAGHSLNYDVLYHVTVFRLDGLGIGGLIAVLSAQHGLPGFVRLHAHRWTAWLLSISALLYLSSILRSAVPWLTIAERSLFPLLVSLGFGALLLDCVQNNTLPARVARTGWLRSFGKYSYGIYVIHYPMLALFPARPGLGSFALSVTGGICLSYAAGVASWHVLEKHFVQLKQHFSGTARRPAMLAGEPRTIELSRRQLEPASVDTKVA